MEKSSLHHAGLKDQNRELSFCGLPRRNLGRFLSNHPQGSMKAR